jgi:hypothetical protein
MSNRRKHYGATAAKAALTAGKDLAMPIWGLLAEKSGMHVGIPAESSSCPSRKQNRKRQRCVLNSLCLVILSLLNNLAGFLSHLLGFLICNRQPPLGLTEDCRLK